MFRHLGLIGLALAGCGGRSFIDYDAGHDVYDPSCSAPAGSCRVQSCAPPQLDGKHVAVCSNIAFASNPPTSGPHYGIWADFKIYDKPVPRGYYLHSEEHSAVILVYNCARYHEPGASCEAMVTAMKKFVAATPADDTCAPPVHNRVMLIPDPDLDAPWAVAAWGYALKGQCFDAGRTSAFITAHYGKNYENLCGAGIDPTDPASMVPANCGK